MEQDDNCYCPHGVVNRTQNKIDFLLYSAIAAAVVGVYKFVSWFLVMVWAALPTAEAVDKWGWYVVGSGCLILGFLHYAQAFQEKNYPWWYRLFLRFRKGLKAFFFKQDLADRFRDRPELSTFTVEDILRDMNDGHHEEEEPVSAEEMEIYLRVFEKLKDDRRKEA